MLSAEPRRYIMIQALTQSQLQGPFSTRRVLHVFHKHVMMPFKAIIKTCKAIRLLIIKERWQQKSCRSLLGCAPIHLPGADHRVS